MRQGRPTENNKELLDIICGLRCDKGFVCYTSGQETLCKAKDIGLDSYLVCLEKDPKECKFFAVIFGDKHICQCPLRVYIAKKMNK
jgi:hypothetical protein